MHINSLLLKGVDSTTRALKKLRGRVRERHGVRSLVGEILSLQMVLTALIGILAITGLVWTSEGLVLSNVDRWAVQWVEELHELGAPLYLENQADVIRGVERFSERYPELETVRYFDADGALIRTIPASQDPNAPTASLSGEVIAALNGAAGSETAHTMNDGPGQGQYVIRSAIWTESIEGDGLLNLDGISNLESDIRTVGFVQLDLDFVSFFDRIKSSVWVASLILLTILACMAIVSRVLLKRLFRSLSSLQAPIEKLAQGDLKVAFPSTPHREISAIVDTLKKTVTSLRQRDSKLRRLANHDALTGLYNRHRFVDELNEEIARLASERTLSALLFIDLDQFKYVNDTCGHPAGDKLLVCAARQLLRSVRKSDSVSRFGGDEFAILVRDVSRREAKAVGVEVLQQMRDFAHVENEHVFQLQCSIGITMIESDRCSADEVVAQADVACHEAKRRGRNRMEFYRVSAKETEQMMEDVGWTQRIKQGLAEDRFELRYQPIVHIATGLTSHHEVLLRLHLPDGRIISPGVFLPAAERFGLMLDIDRWVIERAIVELSRMRVDNPDLNFAVNLSAHAFEDAQLHVMIRQLFELHKVPASSVVFEITEQVAIRNMGDVEKQLVSLKNLGCKVAIDDFGTGYSSFSHLKRFKFDYLKIDGSFVEHLDRDPLDQTMVRLFADIGKGLGVQTIAEYVTEATSYNLLAKYGIDYAQGYHIGRPAKTPEALTVPIPIDIRRQQARKQQKASRARAIERARTQPAS